MGAVWVRTRAELRSSWRSWLVLALLIGLAGGVAVAAAAGARRTATAYPRLVAWSDAADVEVSGLGKAGEAQATISAIERLPSVRAWARVDTVASAIVLPSGEMIALPRLYGVADPDGRYLTTISRPKVLAGRMFDPAVASEAVVDFAAADLYGLHVGDVVRVVLGDPFAEHPSTTPVRIVGVVALPRAFPAFGKNTVFATVELPPAFMRVHHVQPDPAGSSLELRLKGGRSGVPAFLADLRRTGLAGVDPPYVQTVRTDGVQRSLRLEAAALWALAVVTLLAMAAVLGPALARQTYGSSVGFPILRAVGMSRRQLFGIGLLRATIAGAGGAAVAALVACGLSALTPIGLARIAEPTPGFRADVPALVIGASVVLALTVVLAAIPAWRAAGRGAASAAVGSARRSSVADAFGKRVASPVARIGVRMAIDPGGARAPVPVRSTIVGAAVAIATLATSLVFWSSLSHLVATPRLSGFAWDMFVVPAEDDQGNPILSDARRIRAVLTTEDARRDILGYTRGGVEYLEIGGKTVFGLVAGATGPASPVIVAGRAPAAADEIALGRVSMRDAGVGIGDRLPVRIAQQDPSALRTVRVVGEVILPTWPFGETTVGEGAALSPLGVAGLYGEELTTELQDGLPFLIRFRDGIDAPAAFARLQALLPEGTFSFQSQHRGDITTLGRITNVPLMLALVLSVIAFGTLAQMLVTSVRARRRDLAILKTIGFSRRQIGAAVAVQATTLIALALAIGIPAGLLAGRWIWRTFAVGLAVVPIPIVDLGWVLAAIPVTLLLANLIAAIPASAAARTKPAMVLRSE